MGFFSMLAHPSSDIVGETNPRAKAAKCFQGFVTGFYSFFFLLLFTKKRLSPGQSPCYNIKYQKVKINVIPKPPVKLVFFMYFFPRA